MRAKYTYRIIYDDEIGKEKVIYRYKGGNCHVYSKSCNWAIAGPIRLGFERDITRKSAQKLFPAAFK
jgi:hypothetical protein